MYFEISPIGSVLNPINMVSWSKTIKLVWVFGFIFFDTHMHVFSVLVARSPSFPAYLPQMTDEESAVLTYYSPRVSTSNALSLFLRTSTQEALLSEMIWRILRHIVPSQIRNLPILDSHQMCICLVSTFGCLSYYIWHIVMGRIDFILLHKNRLTIISCYMWYTFTDVVWSISFDWKAVLAVEFYSVNCIFKFEIDTVEDI